ncbi:MAG: condensation domain-containing protein, partial [Pyrinomonadaceae bacterium]
MSRTIADHIGQLSPEKIRQLALAINKKKAVSSGPALRRHPGRTDYPLSFGQERLWFIDKLVPGNAAYNWPFAVRFGFNLDPEVFRRSLVELSRRHEVLRTAYPAVENTPVQRVHPAGDLPFVLEDLSHLPRQAAEALAMEALNRDARAPFDLEAGPLARYLLFHVGSADWIFGGTMHHSIADAWSRKVLMEDISVIWSSLARGIEPSLPELPVQYGDYAIWQR